MVGEVDTVDVSTTLGHDRHKAALLKAIVDLRQQEGECFNATHSKGLSVQRILENNSDASGIDARAQNTLLPPKETQVVEDKILSTTKSHQESFNPRIPTCLSTPKSEFDGFDDVERIDQSPKARPPLGQETPTSYIPTYPAIPKLQSSIATESVHDTHTLTSRHKHLPDPPLPKLSTVIEDKPPTYKPTNTHTKSKFTFGRRTGTTSDEDDKITSLPDVPAQEQCSRTNTMSSTNSIHSHQGPCPIYISPSMQLQRMQGIGELDLGRQRLRAHTPMPFTRSQASSLLENYSSSEVRQSTSNEYNVYKAHSQLNNSIRSSTSTPSEHICTRDWARSSEWVASSGIFEGPTEWIEDFLVRREEADRLEEEERRRKDKEKRPGGLLNRVSTIGKHSLNKRRLSKRNSVHRRSSFEARQEITRSRWHVQTPEKNLSWDEDEPSMTVKVHTIHKESDSPPTAPQLSPSPRNSTQITTITTPSRSIHYPTPQRHRFPALTHPRPGKFTFRSVSKIRTNVKRSFSTSVVPALNGGRNSVKELVNKFEKLSGSLRGLGRKGAVKMGGGRRGGKGE